MAIGAFADKRRRRALGLKRQRGGTNGLSRPEAERELRRRIDSIVVSVEPGQSKTVEDAGWLYVEHLRVVKRRKRTTLADYEGYLRGHFAAWFGQCSVDKLKPDDVEEYMLAKLDRLAPKTMSNHLIFLRGLLGFCVRRRWCETNVCDQVDRPTVTQQHASCIRFLQPT